MGRPMRGSRLASFYTSGSDTDSTTPPSLSTLDSAFQLQEYIGALVRLNPHDVERIVKLPGRTAGDDKERLKDGEGEDERGSVDEACWIYEQLRRLAQDLTHPLITTLQQECTRQSCPEMKAGEWLYLCVAHGNSGAMEHCCAIDYIVHTLDSATALLNSPRAFPSRISIPPTSHRHFPSLARRLGRIFAHAYYHHRLAFESAEAESALYARFLALSRRFDLVPAEFLVIPAASGSGSRNESDESKIFSRDPVPTSTYTSPPAPDSTSATVVPANSPSPRIGGRARTDTMYLPGGYVSPHGTGSPAHGVSPKISPKPRLEELWGGDAMQRLDEQNWESETKWIMGSGVGLRLPQAKEKEGDEPSGEKNVPVTTAEPGSDVKHDAPEAEGSPERRKPGLIRTRDFALEKLPVGETSSETEHSREQATDAENEPASDAESTSHPSEPTEPPGVTSPSSPTQSDPPLHPIPPTIPTTFPSATAEIDSPIPPYSELPEGPSITLLKAENVPEEMDKAIRGESDPENLGSSSDEEMVEVKCEDEEERLEEDAALVPAPVDGPASVETESAAAALESSDDASVDGVELEEVQAVQLGDAELESAAADGEDKDDVGTENTEKSIEGTAETVVTPVPETEVVAAVTDVAEAADVDAESATQDV